MTTGRRLYLAYGSNLNRAQMATRCPQAQAIAKVMITHHWQLGFFGEQTKRWGQGGVASLVPSTIPFMTPGGVLNALTPGALYLLTAEEEKLLDGFEGYPHYYDKREDFAQFTTAYDRQPSDVVFAYLKNDVSLPNPPSQLYLETIAQGYRDWRFEHYLESLMLLAGRTVTGS